MTRVRAAATAALLALVVSWASPALPYCFEQAAAYYGLSPEVLRSIARVESRENHASINWNTNGTYDVGLMQINSSWRPVLGEALWSLLYYDPCWNAYCGAYILSTCIHRHGYTWEAVGCYHSRKRRLADRYILKVFKEMEKQRRAQAGGP